MPPNKGGSKFLLCQSQTHQSSETLALKLLCAHPSPQAPSPSQPWHPKMEHLAGSKSPSQSSTSSSPFICPALGSGFPMGQPQSAERRISGSWSPAPFHSQPYTKTDGVSEWTSPRFSACHLPLSHPMLSTPQACSSCKCQDAGIVFIWGWRKPNSQQL